jgi:putative protease
MENVFVCPLLTTIAAISTPITDNDERMRLHNHHLELLSPARDAGIAREAIFTAQPFTSADRVWRPPQRQQQPERYRRAGAFAHRYGAKVFVTLNTILHDDELEPAQRLITDLYEAGVDALIVQDMGMWSWIFRRLSCTPAPSAISAAWRKRNFSRRRLSQIVLARELNLQQIKAIYDNTDATIEFFIHGALCVAYSGSAIFPTPRPAQRQPRRLLAGCRLPYTLKDDQGVVV